MTATRARCRWESRATLALIAINVSIFAAAPGALSPWAMRASDVLDGSVWQLWTSTFLHLDISYLIQNMVSLLVFGMLVTRAAGCRAFLLLYTVCGIAAGAAFVLLSTVGFTDPSVVSLGSSGCILGLVAAAPILSPDLRVWFGPSPLWIVSLAAVAYYAWSVYAGDRGGDVFHLAGMAAGTAMAVSIRIRAMSADA